MPRQGLYANIHKRRAEGKAPRKAGNKNRPTNADFKRAARTAKKTRKT